MWQRSEVGCVTGIFRRHPHLGLENNKQNLIFNSSRDWKPMEMFLDVGGDMGVTGKSGNESCSCVQYSLKGRLPGLSNKSSLWFVCILVASAWIVFRFYE